MPDRLVIHATVDASGRLDPFSSGQARHALKVRAGRKVKVTIEDPTRSTSANRYYWGFVIRPLRAALTAAGYTLTDDEIHDWLARKHAGTVVVITPDGEEVRRRVSTAKMAADEFRAYIAAVETDPVVRGAMESIGGRIETPEEYERRTGEKIKGGAIHDDAR